LNAAEIIAAMGEFVPPGRIQLDPSQQAGLLAYTADLCDASPNAESERQRYRSVISRQIPMDEVMLRHWLAGKTILVTGGTGCIGSALVGQLTRYGAARIVSVSRGLTSCWTRYSSVDYLNADVRDSSGLLQVFRKVQPDIVFHLAAQREPGLAEREVHRTVSTNVLGTANVADLADYFGVAELIHASTGKAVRPYSREVYTASKRVAEWVLAQTAARSEVAIAAARFTHVVDNAVVYRNIQRAAADNTTLRIHDPGIAFYVQSALESAQLLLRAGLGAMSGALSILAITDLGWPVSLLDLTLGTLTHMGTAAPVYFSGYDAGYEAVPFPGLYDPRTAGDVSPLLNCFEALTVAEYAGVDTALARYAASSTEAGEAALQELRELCADTEDGHDLRVGLDMLLWITLGATLRAAPERALRRVEAIAAPFKQTMSRDCRRILSAVEYYAQNGEGRGAGAAGVHVGSSVDGAARHPY
jgi:nucleoside-diphosphate-sugar epimerase